MAKAIAILARKVCSIKRVHKFVFSKSIFDWVEQTFYFRVKSQYNIGASFFLSIYLLRCFASFANNMLRLTIQIDLRFDFFKYLMLFVAGSCCSQVFWELRVLYSSGTSNSNFDFDFEQNCRRCKICSKSNSANASKSKSKSKPLYFLSLCLFLKKLLSKFALY